MLLDDQSTRELKAYLLSSLESITDTDVQMLADYIVALLKHDKPLNELQSVCIEQLTDFLGTNTTQFVERLFQFLRRISQAQQRPAAVGGAKALSGWSDDDGKSSTQTDRPRQAQSYVTEKRDSDSRRRDYGDGNGWSSGGTRDRNSFSRDQRDSFSRNGSRDDLRSRGGRGRVFDRISGGSWGGGNSEESRDSSWQQQKPRFGDRQSGTGLKRPRCERVEVQKLPVFHLNVPQLSSYFSRFGKITRIAIDKDAQIAVIEYATVEEATACVQSTDAPFNNRFVRLLFWNSPMPEQASVINEPQPQVIFTTEEKKQKAEQAERIRAELQLKMELLQRQQDEERRRLLEKLNSVGEEDRQQILTALSDVSKTVATTVSVLQQPPIVKKPRAGENPEILAQISQMPGATTEDLKAQLETLKKQHAELGLANSDDVNAMMVSPATEDATASPAFTSWRGRGRGRGRASFHPYARTARKLDLRPKSLKITNIPATMTEPLLKQHFGKFGDVVGVQIQNDGSVIVSYGARWFAENAIAKAAELEGGHQLQLSWHSDPNQQTQQRPLGSGGDMEIVVDS